MQEMQEKINFYDVIKDYNVIGIITGHYHKSYINKWKGINVYNGSGNGMILLGLNTQGEIVFNNILNNATYLS